MINELRERQINVNTQEAMLRDIQQLQFYLVDLALFLDTHPNDPVALYRHQAFSQQLMQLKHEYETLFGPMTIFGLEVGNTWRYINGPWPWEM